ncbi:ankyrin repeat domain-containing protein [Shewanella sp. 10N.286.45.A1]|uniref:ankyrin repeat domain-containing protein n=1 Tax=Shewanella sp. 10N.286.45.A1 TaxID=3229694 RepID=UPI003552662D
MKYLLISLLIFISVTSHSGELEKDLLISITDNNIEQFQKLLVLGANPNYRDDNAKPSTRPVVMELAAIHDDSIYLELAIKHGGHPDALDGYKSKTILFESSKHSKLNNVKVLIKSGAKINSLDGNNSTPLHIAISVKNYDIAYYLIKSGASLSLQNKWGYTPIDILNKFGDAGVKKDSSQYQWYLKVIKLVGV